MNNVADCNLDQYNALIAREFARIAEAGGTWAGYRKFKRRGDTVALCRADRAEIFGLWVGAGHAPAGTVAPAVHRPQPRAPWAPERRATMEATLQAARAARAGYTGRGPVRSWGTRDSGWR